MNRPRLAERRPRKTKAARAAEMRRAVEVRRALAETVSTWLAQSPRAALTVQEFCRAHGISRAQYYGLQKRGHGPREIRINAKLSLITMEAASEWRERHTAKPTQPNTDGAVIVSQDD